MSAQYMSSNFVLAAGCVLFRESPIASGTLQICLLHHHQRRQWVLPKGRKDRGESMEATAVRETFEETGYPCELVPCKMPTRAPQIGVNTRDVVAIADNVTEPFAISVRELAPNDVKMIWWFLARVKPGSTGRIHGTQTDSENFESQFFDADDGLQYLPSWDGEIVKKALDLLTSAISEQGLEAVLPQ